MTFESHRLRRSDGPSRIGGGGTATVTAADGQARAATVTGCGTGKSVPVTLVTGMSQ